MPCQNGPLVGEREGVDSIGEKNTLPLELASVPMTDSHRLSRGIEETRHREAQQANYGAKLPEVDLRVSLREQEQLAHHVARP